MKNILILGARAPASLELARQFKNAGHNVYLADSLNYPLGFFSRNKNKYLLLPKPRYELDEFGEKINEYIKKYNINLIIPTCEEAFYLSKIKNKIDKKCEIFVSDFDLMVNLHNKEIFNKLEVNSKVRYPKSIIVNNEEELKNEVNNMGNYVLKRCYSRFASMVYVDPGSPPKVDYEKDNPWLMQEYIKGEECCSYSVFSNGELLASALYKPKYKVGKGSGIYFKSYENEIIKEYIKAFGKKNNYHGQVGFDFIIKDNVPYVLECNPRATSGVHMLEGVDKILTNEKAKAVNEDKMVKMAMLVFGFKYLFKTPKSFIKDFIKAKDVIRSENDKYLNILQFLSVFEIIKIAFQNKVSLLKASTKDIEYDG